MRTWAKPYLQVGLTIQGGILHCLECNSTEILRSAEQRICRRHVRKKNREVPRTFDSKGVLPPADRSGATRHLREFRSRPRSNCSFEVGVQIQQHRC